VATWASSQLRADGLRASVESRAVTMAAWASSDQTWGEMTGASNVTQDNASKIIAVLACTSLYADTISSLPVHVFRDAATGTEKMALPDWMQYPVPGDQNVTWADHISQVMLSLLYDGNAFVLTLPDVYRPLSLEVFHPQSVEVKNSGGIRSYKLPGGSLVGSDQMLHLARNRKPGQDRGMSPIDQAAGDLAAATGQAKYIANLYNKGAHLRGVLSSEQARPPAEVVKEAQEAWEKEYGGIGNAGKTAMLWNGTKFQPLTLSPTDLAFVETHAQTVEDVARLYRVPLGMIQINKPGAVSYSSAEQFALDWVKYSIRPYVVLLETGYFRLLPRPRSIQFALEGLLRGDLKSRAEGYGQLIQNSVMRPSEARRLEDLPADATADRIFGNAALVAQDTAMLRAKADAAKTLIDAGVAIPDALAAAGLPAMASAPEPPAPAVAEAPTPNPNRDLMEAITAAVTRTPEEPFRTAERGPNGTIRTASTGARFDIRVEPTPVQVTNPAPIVNVAPPVVNVAAPEVHVAAPEVRVEAPIVNMAAAEPMVIPAPVVNVTTPDVISIASMPRRTTTRRITARDQRGITETIDVEEDA